MSSPALQAHLNPAGKVLDDPPAFLPWDRFYGCCDCCLQVRDGLGVVAKSCNCSTILLEPLEGPDNPFLLTKCCPELTKHLDILLGVDCHRLLVVVLEPEWPNDAMLGYGDPGCALHRV